jgi:subtilisin family serine protease
MMQMPMMEALPATKHQEKISPTLRTTLTATGVGQAVVILEEPAAASAAGAPYEGVADDLADAFVDEDESAAAMLFRFGRDERAALKSARSRHADSRFMSSGGTALSGGGATSRPRAQLFPGLGVMIGDVRVDGAARLADDPRVRFVAASPQFSLIRPLESAAAARRETTTWGLEALAIPRFWAAGLDGTGVLVGHLDTGADGSHPALAGAIAHFLYVTPGGLPGHTSPATDTDEHGTHTAATIAGRAVGGRHVGVAPGATLAVATVIEGGQVGARVIAGLNWAVTRGVKVVSLSLGFRGYVPDFHPILQRVRERGVLPVVAVGNEGPGTSRSPGNYDNVLSVGASTASRSVWQWSGSQRFARPVDPLVPDVVAPGVDVISAVPGGGYRSFSGTSMATPHVAGIAALLWQAKPTATAAEIEQAIQGSAKLGSMPAERAGRGLVDPVRAYELLTGKRLPSAAAPRRARTKSPKNTASRARTTKRRAPASRKKATKKKR